MASAGRPRPCCAASPRAARRCAKRKPTASADEVSPHPNPPPQAGEGVRGEAEDGWGLLKIAGEKSEAPLPRHVAKADSASLMHPAVLPKVVDGRDKPGHDGLGSGKESLGRK